MVVVEWPPVLLVEDMGVAEWPPVLLVVVVDTVVAEWHPVLLVEGTVRMAELTDLPEPQEVDTVVAWGLPRALLAADMARMVVADSSTRSAFTTNSQRVSA